MIFFSFPLHQNSQENYHKMEPKYEEGTRKKIATLLSVASATGHSCLVLSALGCGAFQNPPIHIALLFKEALDSPKFKRKFRKIVFAVYRKGAAASEANYAAFEEVFGQGKRDGDGERKEDGERGENVEEKENTESWSWWSCNIS